MLYVAFSGGPDSCCLTKYLKQQGEKVHLLHFDHQWEEDKELVKKCITLAKNLDCPITILRGDKSNDETSARRARYQALSKYNKVYVAHTQQDTLETALINLSRNPSLKGVSSLTNKERYIKEFNLHIIRPLLNWTKEETTKYCNDNNIDYHQDPYNKELNIPRCRVRHNILPEFFKIHLGSRKNLLKFINICKETDEFITEIVNEVWPKVFVYNKLYLPILLTQKDLIIKHIFLRYSQTIGVTLKNKDLNYLVNFIKGPNIKSRNFKRNISFIKENNYVYIKDH